VAAGGDMSEGECPVPIYSAVNRLCVGRRMVLVR